MAMVRIAEGTQGIGLGFCDGHDDGNDDIVGGDGDGADHHGGAAACGAAACNVG